MMRMIAIHKVTDVKAWKSFDAERTNVLGAFARDIVSFTDLSGGATVALTFTLTDQKGLDAFMRSAEGAAVMSRHGVLQPVTLLSA